MIEMLGLLWLRPFWLFGPIAALALAALLWRRAGGLGAWERAADPALLSRMRDMGRVASAGRARDIAAAALIGLIALALAGPATERRDAPTWRNLDGVVIILDISASVTESGRLLDAQTAARLIAERAGSRRTALIVYAGEAWVASAFTTDTRALGGAISLIEADTAPVAGSRPEQGLALARRMLDDAGIIAADVVLIGDGDGVGAAATDAARALAARGAPVSTIHSGGRGATAKAATAATAALAAAGGGATGDLADPFTVAARVAGGSVARLAQTGFSALVVADYGRWLLLLALVPAFLALPRRRRA